MIQVCEGFIKMDLYILQQYLVHYSYDASMNTCRVRLTDLNSNLDNLQFDKNWEQKVTITLKGTKQYL